MLNEINDIIRKPHTHEANDKFKDVVIGLNEFILDANTLKIRFMDFDNSFYVDLFGEGFSYKKLVVRNIHRYLYMILQK